MICKILILTNLVLISFQIFPKVCGDDILSEQDVSIRNFPNYYNISFDNDDLIKNELNSEKSVSSAKSENFDWFLKVPLLPIVVATSNSIPEGPCKNQLRLYLNHLRNGTLWAAEMFDASAKYPYGIFFGHVRHLGSFDQCKQIKTTVIENGKIEEIRSRYCLVDVLFKEKYEPSTVTEKFDIFFDPQNSAWEPIRDKDYRRYRRNFLQLALCFPAACQPKEIVIALEEPIEKFSLQNNLEVNVSILPNYCTPMKDSSKFSFYDILFSIVWFIIITLAIVSTIMDTNSGQDNNLSFSRELLSCFSARRGFKEIFSISYGHRGFDSTHFIRVFCASILVFGHRESQNVFGGNLLGTYLEWVGTTPYFAFLHHFPFIIVDGFLGLSGLVMSYFWLADLDKPIKFNNGLRILKRFLRLTPLFMFVTFAYATVFYHLGNGPLWEITMGSTRQACSSHWWANLFFVNNYFSASTKCIIQSWYLAVDFQCFLIGVLVIGAFHKMPRKIGYTFLGCCLICSMAVPFYLTYNYNLDAICKTLMRHRIPEESDCFLNNYVKTHIRSAPYFVGLIIGVFIYDYKFASWRIPKIWTQFVCIPLVIILFFVTPSIGHFFVNPNIETSLFQKAFYAAVHRPLFALCICLIPLFMTICEGLDSYYNFMTYPWFQPISKLSYGIYLTHFLIPQYDLGTTRTSFTSTFYNAARYFIGDVIMSLLLALFFVITIELPFKNVTNLCLRRNLKTLSDSSGTLKKKK